MSEDTGSYVGHGAWLHPAGRVDAIDDVADQCERRRGPVASAGAAGRWPKQSTGWRSGGWRSTGRRSRGWRSFARLHARRESITR